MTALDLGLADGQGFQSSAGLLWHVLATLAAFTAWQVARRRGLFSPAALTLVDAAGTVGLCVAYAVMGHFLRQPFGFYTALLAILHVNVGRAALQELAPQLIPSLAPGGWMAVSGFSPPQSSLVGGYLAPLVEVRRAASDEWAALVLI